MKKFALFLFALLMISFSVLAQIKLVVCQEGGIRSEFIASNVDSIIFVGLEDTPDVPVKPDDGDDDIDTPEVELPGEGKIRFLIDATAVGACYGLGIEGNFCGYNPDAAFKGTEFAENMFYIDMPSMTAEEFGNAKILLLDEYGYSYWDYKVSSYGYDITGSEDYIVLVDDFGAQNCINLVGDGIDNVIIKVAILEVDDTPCKPDVPAGRAKFVFTMEGECKPEKVFFTGNFEEQSWIESEREMTKQANGTYVWEGEYPINFQFKTIAMVDGELVWLDGSNRYITVESGSVINFSGCFYGYCPGDEIVVPDEDPIVPEGSNFVAKPFSVSASKAVTFSPGNLQYHPANDEWRFAPNQTDYIGEDNANISSTYNGWIDLFGWGTGNNPTNKSTDYEDYQTFVDWGVNKIGNYAPNTWRTLTETEWEYLIKERPNYEKLIGVAQVNGVNGLILLPDNWTCPSGVTFKAGFHDNYGTDYYAKYQTFSSSEWSKLEASGAVFFPAAGRRYGSDVRDVQDSGYYWSATEYGGDYGAYYLYFGSGGAYMSYYDRSCGQSVRLVQD